MVYRNIISLLKMKINSSTLSIGDALPSENELANLYNVSRNTLRKALKELEFEGLIERKHGSGTRIKNKQFQASLTRLGSFTEIALNEEKKTRNQLIKFELQGAPEEIAMELQIQTGEPVYYVRRLRFIEKIAVQLEDTWLSVNRFPDLTITHMQNSKFSYIENECGVEIHGKYESMIPVIPTSEIAYLLNISPQDPIIKSYTQAIDEQHRPVDYSILYTNSFEFKVKYYFPRSQG